MFRVSRLLIAAVTAAAVLPAVADYTLVHPPNPEHPMPVSIYKLDNGLMVYITENHEAPRFYAEIAVRAGSKHDPAETTGLAHYLEHLLFKGSRTLGTLSWEQEQPLIAQIYDLYEERFIEQDAARRDEIYEQINRLSQAAANFAIPNEVDSLYSAMGNTHLNAHTWYEETVYSVELPKNRLRQWAIIEAERFTHPVFRLFHTELETVYEEKNRALDNKMRIIQEAVDRLLYKHHPYGQHSVLGSVEHLKNPNPKIIDEYFRTYYVPNNMGIFLSGAIDTEETIAIINEHFAHWEPAELPALPPWDEPPLDGVERVTVKYEGEEYVSLAFRTVPRSHPDAEPLQLLDMILDNRVAGLINLNLNQAQKVRNAGSYPMQHNDMGAQYLYGIPRDGQTLEEVEKLLLEQIEIIKRGDFDDWILEAIITDFKKNEKQQLEQDRSRVAAMRSAFIAHEDWDHAVQRIERMEKLTKDDVVRVANKYFTGDYVAGYRIDAPHEIPEGIEKPNIDVITIDPTRRSARAREILDMPVEPIEPEYIQPGQDYQTAAHPHGVTYYYASNPINDLFSLTITIDFGTHENNKIRIADQLLNKSGTENLTAEELSKEWYKLGTDFGMGAGDNETNITISGLDENFETSVALLMDVLNKPAAPEQTLEELKQIILVSRADAKKDPQSIHSALVQYNRHGDESYFLRMLPSAPLLELTNEDLYQLIRDLLSYKHTVSYVGTLPFEKVRSVYEKHHTLETELKDPPPYKFLKARAPEQNEIYFVQKDVAQANIRLEFGTQDYQEADIPAIQIFNEYFGGGMGGIVFQELREARALAYVAGARYAPGSRLNDQDLMLGVIGTQADKTPEAVEAFVQLLDNMPDSPERFDMARVSVENRYRTGKVPFRQVTGTVRAWEKLGLEPDPRKPRFDIIRSAEKPLLFDFVHAHIQGKPKLISIVGDGSKIDFEKLAQFGKIVDISEDQIFVD
jgi:predicted Zn-dependent peptidase